MSEEGASYRRILRSTSIIGGATLGSILIGLVRMKAFALMLGPAGVGLLGLFHAILTTGAALAGMGLSSSGVRHIAAAAGDPGAERLARWSIWSLTFLFAIVAGGLMWILKHPLALLITGRPGDAAAIGWLGLGVGLSAIAASQVAVLQGYRRMGDLARIRLYGSLVGAALGIALVYALGNGGIVPALLAMPVGGIIVGVFHRRHAPPLSLASFPGARILPEWRLLAALGFVLMLSGLLATVAQIVIRAVITRDLNLEAAGLYQAAWMVSATNVGVILAAMTADYFPRLSELKEDRAAISRLVNQQFRVALLLAGPLVAAVIAGAPLVLQILYSSEFSGASRLLQWQLAGDVLKLAGWSLGYVLIVRKDMGFFLLAETSFAFIYVLLVVWLIDPAGLEAAGMAYFAAQLTYSVLMIAICARRHDVRLDPSNAALTFILVGTMLSLIALSALSAALGYAAGFGASVLLGVYAVRQIGAAVAQGGAAASIAGMLARLRS